MSSNIEQKSWENCVDRIVKIRNDLTHADSSRGTKTPQELKLDEPCEVFGCLFKLHIAKMCDFPTESISILLQKFEYFYDNWAGGQKSANQ